MTRGPTLLLLGMFAMTAPVAPARAQPPAPAEWDKLVVDALKQAHNKGADLYNTGDAAGGFRLYQGALLTARPLLAHRPAAQKIIDDGFAEVAKSAGMVKLQAFRLHEVIEHVRGELKAGLKADAARPAAPKPTETPKPTAPAADDTEPLRRVPTPPMTPKSQVPSAAVGGTVTLDGKPAGGAEVTFVSVGRPEPRVFTATATAAGLYALDGVPAGDYTVMVTPGKGGATVPVKFQSVATSGLTVTVAAGANTRDFDLK